MVTAVGKKKKKRALLSGSLKSPLFDMPNALGQNLQLTIQPEAKQYNSNIKSEIVKNINCQDKMIMLMTRSYATYEQPPALTVRAPNTQFAFVRMII